VLLGRGAGAGTEHQCPHGQRIRAPRLRGGEPRPGSRPQGQPRSAR
jgi:hypothetical protein